MRPISGRTSKSKRALDRTRRVGRGARRGYLATDRAVIGAVRKIVPPKVSQAAVGVMPDRMKYVRHAILPAVLLLVVWLVFFNAHAATTGYGGTKTFSAALDQSTATIATFGDEVYTSTTFQGTVNFGQAFDDTDQHGTVSASAGAAITKTTEGAYKWTHSFSSDGAVTVRDIVATDQAVYAVGFFSGEVDFAQGLAASPQSHEAQGISDGFILKLNADGTFGWVATYGSSSTTLEFNAATMVGSGRLITGGRLIGEEQFDPTGVVRNTAGSSYGIVLAIDDEAAPTYAWDYALTSNDIASINAISPLGMSTFAIGGTIKGNITLTEGVSYDSDGGTDAVVVKLSDAGAYVSHTIIGGEGAESVTALNSNDQGDLYVAGNFDTTLDVAGMAEPYDAHQGALEGYLMKLDDEGLVYAHQIGGDNAIMAMRSIMLGESSVYVVGRFSSGVDFGASFQDEDVLTSAGNTSGFITVLSESSNTLAYDTTYMTGAKDADPVKGAVRMLDAAASDPDDTITIVGDYTETIDFASAFGKTDERTSGGARDAFVTTIVTRPMTTLSGGELRYEDTHGVNLSDPGTQEISPLVTVRDDDDTRLAQLTVNMTESRTWSTIEGDTDHIEYRSFLSGILGQPGAEGAATYTFYVPRGADDKAVAICPNAASLEDVNSDCAGRQTYTDGAGATLVTLDENTEYWQITSRDDDKLGGISLPYPGLVITEPAGGWSITEGNALTVGVALRTAPSSNVTIAASLDEPGEASINTPLVFTAENWNEPQQFTVNALDDNLVDGPIDIAVSITISSSDNLYNGAIEPGWTVQALDNDAAGLTWKQSSFITSEADAGQTVELCVEFTAQPSDPVTLALTSSDTTEITIASPLVIQPENWNGDTNCVEATILDDDETDGTQSVTVNITAVTSDDTAFAALVPATLPTVLIENQDTDADTAGFNFTTPNGTTTTEAGGEVEICVTLSARPLAPVTLPLSVDDNSEGELSDDELVIVPDSWNQADNCVTATGLDDKLIDGDVAYNVITGSPSSTDPAWSSLIGENILDVSLINEDDDEASLDISSTSVTAAEGGSTAFTIKPDTQPASGNSITLLLVSSDDSQLTAAPASVTFTEANWQTPQTITITPVDDDLLEGEHIAQIAVVVDDDLTTEVAYRSLSDVSVATTISDNDTATLSITAAQTATEGGGNGAFTVALSKQNDTATPITVTYEVSPASTAIAGTHYVTLSGEVTIPAGTSEADIVIDVTGLNNGVFGGDRTVQVELTGSATAGVTLGSPSLASVVIADDERAQVELSATHGREGGDDVVLTATLDTTNDTGEPLVFTLVGIGGLAAAGDDYEAFTGETVSIAPGQTAGNYTVIVTNDELLEADQETLLASLQLETLPAGVESDETAVEAQTYIEDNDTAIATVVGSDASEPSTSGTFTLTLSEVNNTGSPIAVSYTLGGTAQSGQDYVAVTGSASIASGASNTTVTITPIDDNDIEGDETVVLSLGMSNFARVASGDPDEATLTVHDNEIVGVAVTIPDNSTSEDGETGQVCYKLASRPSADVTLLLSSSDADKVSVSESIRVPRNSWDQPACVTATGLDDETPTATGTVEVTIAVMGIETDDPFYSVLELDEIADATIQHHDNDQPSVIVQAIDTVTSEDGTKSAHIRFRLTTQPTADVTVPLSISDATEGTLDGANNIVLTPASWDTPADNEIVVQGVDDDLTDGTITYELITGEVSSGDNSYDGIAASAVANVTLANEDNDEASVGVDTIRESAIEGGTTAAHDVTIGSQPAEGRQVVITATPTNSQIDLGGGAGQLQQLTFTHENWDETQRITITAVDDNDLEAEHASSVIYSIADATDEPAYNEYEDELPTISVPIEDNDTAGAILIAEDGSETGPGHLVFRVTLDKENRTGTPITFALNGIGGSATAGADYAAIEDVTISVPNGATMGEAQIGILDDALLEGDETVTAAISSASLPAVTITGATATAAIIDDENAELNITATTPTAQENPASSGVFTVQLSRVNNTGTPITAQYSVGGTASPDEDYELLSGVVAIAAGQSSATITVDTDGFDDEVVEGNETVILTLTESDHPLVSVGGSDTATVIIIDDDTFAWSVITEENGTEEGAEPVVFRVRLSKLNTTGAPMTITLADPETGTAAKGEDYDAFDGVVTIPAGEQEATVEVTVIDDEKLERTETIGAVLQNPSQGDIGAANATATIADNDAAELSITASVDETIEGSDEPARFVLSLDKANDATTAILIQYTINGTAVGGQDYALLSGTANIAPGQNQTYINVSTAEYNNNVYTGDRTVEISLESTNHSGVMIGGSSTATVTISEDEPVPVPVDPGPDPTSPSAPSTPQNPGGNGGSVTIVRPQTPVAPSPVAPDGVDSPPDPLPQPVDQTKKDLDSDGIEDATENRAYNDGDGNGDGIPDSMQKNVASLVSDITSRPVTLAVTGDCSTIKRFRVVGENELDKADRAYRYPHGLVDYEVTCPGPGKTADVAVYYDESLGDSYTWRKFMAPSLSFAALEDAQLVQRPVGKSVVTAVAYSITDGDANDDDGKRDGKILDPAGLATHVFRPLDILWLTPIFVLAAVLIGRGILVHRRHHRAAQRISRW